MNRNRKFFLKLAIFIGLVLVLNEGLNLAYDRWMYYFRLARNQDSQFASLPSDSLKYLMLGNSHNRINPEILNPGFCYITPKETYRQTWYKLKNIIEVQRKIPQNILLSIDPVNFSPKAASELSFDGYWRKYLNYSQLTNDKQSSGSMLNWVYGTFFSYVGNYKYVYMSALFFRTDLSKIKHGYFPARNYKNFAKEPNRDQLGYYVASTYLAGYQGKSVLYNTDYYLKILDLCRQHHIHLVLLRMPLTDEYLKYAHKLINIEQLDQEIVDLTRKNYDNFDVFDFRHEFQGKPWYFFNADHVNPTGAAIISHKLKEQLNNRKTL